MTYSLAHLSLLTAMFVAGNGRVTVSIIPPLPSRTSGPDVGLILIPGAQISGSAYTDTVVAIQEACALRVWVALTSSFLLSAPNPLQVPRAVSMAVEKLQEGGMEGDAYVGVAHSLGGVFLVPYAKRRSVLKAVVLLGSYLTKGEALSEYPHPVLTLSGELDGQARITRLAATFQELYELQLTSPDAVYDKPVINIKGSNHAQFASGPMPRVVERYDLAAEISPEDAHAAIGRHVGDFITCQFGQDADRVSEAKTNLKNAFLDSQTRFQLQGEVLSCGDCVSLQPLLDVKALDQSGSSSRWTMMAQEVVAKDAANITTVYNDILGTFRFCLFKPSLKWESGEAAVRTASKLVYARNPLDISTNPESPRDVEVKLKSTDAFQKGLKDKRKPASENAVTCMDLNKMALDVAFENSHPDAQSRFKDKGRPMSFKEDIVRRTGLTWVTTKFRLKEYDEGLSVRSVSLTTRVKSLVHPGMLYCKMISPFTAMEWIYVDSLRAKKP